jgi:hypothetical protein
MENIIDSSDATKKKRGRRKKTEVVESETKNEQNIEFAIENTISESTENIPKKRGRKPKGGKIITKQPIQRTDVCQTANIILHLRCSIDDIGRTTTSTQHLLKDPLEYVPTAPPNISAYIPGQIEKLSAYNQTNEPVQHNAYNEHLSVAETVCSSCKRTVGKSEPYVEPTIADEEIDLKDLTHKLKQLKMRLYKNTGIDKKSACFWCTYEYDNPPCYIPKFQQGEELAGYGSFCRPECAVAYLMKENIDDSAKFERYQLLNMFYGKIYEYRKNIRPAPDPHFLLDKFYGNMSIQEYRKLLGADHMLLVVEKPMTRILPELHEDTDDFSNKLYGNNNQSAQTGVYKVKRQSEKPAGPTKTHIMKEKFGFV